MRKKILFLILLTITTLSFVCAQDMDDSVFIQNKHLFDEDIRMLESSPNYHVINTDYRKCSLSLFRYTIPYSLTGSAYKYLIITTSSVYANIGNKITRYADDINTAYNYSVKIYSVSHADHTDIKEILVSEQTNLCGAVFVGDIDAAYYELNGDYWNSNQYSSWICDLYFMDLNGEWGDIDSNGIYDSHTGHIQPEIFIGRISAAGMNGLVSEIDALSNYFDKNHKYWTGECGFNREYGMSYIDSSWVNSNQFSDVKLLYGVNETDIFGFYDGIYCKNHYLNRIANSRYEFVQLSAHSSPTLHKIKHESTYSTEIFNANTKAYGFNLFCCSACDWERASASQGYLGGAYIYGTNSKTLALVGSTKTGSMLGFSYFYTPLSQGKTIGEALKLWWNNYCGSNNSLYKISWFYGLVILGDPLISFFYDSFPDLYVRDNLLDIGDEPNATTDILTDSPDIWLNEINGSAVSQIKEGHQYIVNVRVHNRPGNPSRPNIKVKLNWSRVGNNMDWNNSWISHPSHPWNSYINRGGYIGEQVINNPINSEGDITLSFLWEVPPRQSSPYYVSLSGNWSFSLLARVEDGHTTYGRNKSSYNINDFVSKNNNVARRNFTVISENFEPVVAALEFLSDYDGLDPIRLQYRSGSNSSGQHLSDFAEIYLQLDSRLTRIWEQIGNVPQGCSYKGNGLFVIKDSIVNLDGLIVDTSVTYFFSTYVKFFKELPTEEPALPFEINQYVLTKDDTIFGGNINFTAVYDEDAYMKVYAFEDKIALVGDSVQFTAASLASDAEYVWLNTIGDTIGSGDELDVIATTTQRYYLVGRSEQNKAIGYDSVTVIVRQAAITSLTPNPANSQTVVNYRLAEDVTSATIVLANATGQTLYSAPLDVTQTSCTINPLSIPTGQYTVRIESLGVTLTSKTLIVY